MFSHSKKNLIISLVCSLAVLAVALVIIYPILFRIDKYAGELAGIKKDLSDFQKDSGNLKDTKEIYSSWQLSLEKINALFIDSEAPIDFIKFLESTSDKHGLKMNITPITIKSESDPWESSVFQLALAGSFSNLSKFLQKLEASPYLIEEQGLNITRLTKDEIGSEQYKEFSTGDVKAVLTIKVYTK